MMKKIILLFLLAILLCQCKQNSENGFGSKAEEVENQKIQDSILKENQRIQDSINKENQRIHMEMVEAGQEKLKLRLQSNIDRLKQELWTAQQELNEINQFQFGRSQSEKDSQLANQNAKIRRLQSMIRGAENVLPKLGVYKTHEFNNSPKSLIEELFRASKARDFSNFQYYVDPYAEGDGELLELAYIQGVASEYQNQIAATFGNGRIMSEVQQIGDDKAEVEIAIGSSSNRLEKVTLVNRMGNWYLYSM